MSRKKPLFEGADWNFALIGRVHDAIEGIARDELRLDCYRPHLEMISSEQMLDAYASIGLPMMYKHWSFGMDYAHHERLYRKGAVGLAYEIVINSDPCLIYLLEDNTMALQTLTIAHAAFGHNHFFKNNRLFRDWTDADSILDFLEYAKRRVAYFEERYGRDEVEVVLDAAHALMPNSVFRYVRPHELTKKEIKAREKTRWKHEEQRPFEFFMFERTAPAHQETHTASSEEAGKEKRKFGFPEENLLCFLEQHSPILRRKEHEWKREVLSIVRHLAQYFYPQRQTKVMNEGCACFVHYYIIHRLHEEGLIGDGAMLEILHSHTNVLTQPAYNDPRYSGINPYALGFNIMMDIRRIAEGYDHVRNRPCTPDERAENRDWFPEFAEQGNWLNILLDAWENYRDESFIRQFAGPELFRRMRLFSLRNDTASEYYEVTGIHNERDFERVRGVLANMFDVNATDLDIQVVDADLSGTRRLDLRFTTRNNSLLEATTAVEVNKHIQQLWGYEVVLETVDSDGNELDIVSIE